MHPVHDRNKFSCIGRGVELAKDHVGRAEEQVEDTLSALYVKVKPEHQVEKMLKIVCEKVETGKSSSGGYRLFTLFPASEAAPRSCFIAERNCFSTKQAKRRKAKRRIFLP